MYAAIGLYLLIGLLFNKLIDLLFDHLEKNSLETGIVEGDLEKFDNFTKFVAMIFWPFVVLYVLVSIIKEYTK